MNHYYRFALSLAFDQLSALYPNTDAPFEDAVDVVNRLLPYHIFRHPQENLDTAAKGKAKSINQEVVDEIEGTKNLVFLYALCRSLQQKRDLH